MKRLPRNRVEFASNSIVLVRDFFVHWKRAQNYLRQSHMQVPSYASSAILHLFFLIVVVGSSAAATVPVLVVDDVSGQPISDVRIALVGNGKVVAEAKTNTQGRSALVADNGIYCVRAEANGYVDPLDTLAGDCHVVDVSGKSITLHLVMSGSISGTVTDDHGNPVQEAKVVAVPAGNSSGNSLQPVGQGGHTDDRGMYRLFGLPPGRYSVAAVPTGEDTTTPTFVTTFLGGRDYKSAEVLDLTPGQMAESINLTVDLNISSRSKITGTVSNSCLSPENCHAAVMLFSRNGLITPVDQRVTDKNGTFEFDDIPDGDYLIASWTPAVDWPLTNEFPTGIRKAVITHVSTLGGEEIELTLDPTVTITAHMSGRKASDACHTPDRLYLRSEDGWPSLWMGAATSSNQVSWGPLPSGSYRVIVPNNPNACELVSIKNGTRDSHVDQPVRLAGDSSVLELMFSPAKGEVSGVVTAGADSLIQGYVLLLGSGRSSIRRVIQVDKGHFSFPNVPAGSYYLAAFENLHSAAANLSSNTSASNTSADAYAVTIDSAHERVDNLVLTLH